MLEFNLIEISFTVTQSPYIYKWYRYTAVWPVYLVCLRSGRLTGCRCGLLSIFFDSTLYFTSVVLVVLVLGCGYSFDWRTMLSDAP